MKLKCNIKPHLSAPYIFQFPDKQFDCIHAAIQKLSSFYAFVDLHRMEQNYEKALKLFMHLLLMEIGFVCYMAA